MISRLAAMETLDGGGGMALTVTLYCTVCGEEKVRRCGHSLIESCCILFLLLELIGLCLHTCFSPAEGWNSLPANCPLVVAYCRYHCILLPVWC